MGSLIKKFTILFIGSTCYMSMDKKNITIEYPMSIILHGETIKIDNINDLIDKKAAIQTELESIRIKYEDLLPDLSNLDEKIGHYGLLNDFSLLKARQLQQILDEIHTSRED